MKAMRSDTLTIGLVSDMVCLLIASMQSHCHSLVVNKRSLCSYSGKCFEQQ